MFSYERSELSIPIVGFLLLGFSALLLGINILNNEWDIFPPGITTASIGPCYYALGILLAVVAFFAFSKLFMIEGVSFGIFAVFLFIFGSINGVIIERMAIVGLVLAIVAILLVIMSYRVGDILITIVGIASVIAFIPLLFIDSMEEIVAVTAIGFIIVAAVSLYYAVSDWMLVQDIGFDLEDELYGDECGCGCGCGCEDDAHGDGKCDCGCEDHKK